MYLKALAFLGIAENTNPFQMAISIRECLFPVFGRVSVSKKSLHGLRNGVYV